MNLEECYARFNGDYQAVMKQLGSEALVERFLLKFPGDGTMNHLREVVENDPAEAFVASHTLKGIATNLALKALTDAASELTEQLRPKTVPADMELYKKVDECYRLVVDTIAEYLRQKEV